MQPSASNRWSADIGVLSGGFVPVDQPTSLLALFRRRVPLLLWAGQVISTSGDRLYGVALIWVTLRLTGSPADVAIVSAADTVPFLVVSLISGWMSDRYDGLRMARLVDIARAAVVAIVPLLYLVDALNVTALAVIAAVLSAMEAFFLPALQASLPRLVEPAAVTPMVSLLDSTDRLGRILGPGMVAVLAVLPEIHLFTVDAATFVVSALCLTAILRRIAAASRPSASASRRCSLVGARSSGAGSCVKRCYCARSATWRGLLSPSLRRFSSKVGTDTAWAATVWCSRPSAQGISSEPLPRPGSGLIS